jgi:hypothetical protein
MPYALWTLLSIVSYIGGLIVIIKVTPKLSTRPFDEGMFMGMAAVDIIGALLAFGGIVVLLTLFDGSWPIKGLAFVLLVGILIVSARVTLSCLQPRVVDRALPISRVLAGSYGLFLAAAALFCMVKIFMPW